MSVIQSVIGQIIGAVVQYVLAVASRDRKSLIIERRAKVLSLAKEMKAAGLNAGQLRDLERRLTRED